MAIKDGKIYLGVGSQCVDYFLLDSLYHIHQHENWRCPQTGMNLKVAPAHKVAMKDDNWCQNLFNLLVRILLI